MLCPGRHRSRNRMASKKSDAPLVVWFRDDLRLSDHAALRYALHEPARAAAHRDGGSHNR